MEIPYTSKVSPSKVLSIHTSNTLITGLSTHGKNLCGRNSRSIKRKSEPRYSLSTSLKVPIIRVKSQNASSDRSGIKHGLVHFVLPKDFIDTHVALIIKSFFAKPT